MLIIDKLNSIVTLQNGIDVMVRKSLKAKRTQIRVIGGQATLVIPTKETIAVALKFLSQKQGWLEKNLSNYQKISFAHNTKVTILSHEYLIIHSFEKSRGIILNANELIIYGNPDTLEIRVKKFIGSILKQEIHSIALRMCEKLRLSFTKISIKDMNTRWGSCSSKGNLSFSLKLAFTDRNILEYIVAHEVSHLKEMNHSKNFWTLVESLYPNWQYARNWLKEHGKYVV